jgi:hypothetical protein
MLIGAHRQGYAALARHFGIVLLAAWGAVWTGYRIIAPASQFRHVAPEPNVRTPAIAHLVSLVPWPKEFSVGFGDLMRIAKEQKPAFLLGHQWTGHVWWYWPGSLLVKLPASTLLLLALGVVVALFGRERRALLAVGIPMLTITATTVFNAFDFGARYLLPVVALGLVLGGGAVVRIATQWRKTRGIFVLLALAQVFWFVQAQPNSIAWTAPPFRPGYQVATDSNFDWGQDLYRLRDWAKGQTAYVAYFGGPGSSPGWAGAKPLPFRSAQAASGLQGIVVVSASNLTGSRRPMYGWLRAYCPVGLIGRTLFVYRFNGLVPSSHIPVRPPRVCSNRTVSTAVG